MNVPNSLLGGTIVAKSFKEKIREERERSGLSLEQLAERIESSKSYMWELETKDSARPSADKVFKLAEVFGVTPEYLMDDTGRLGREAEQLDRAFFSKFQKLSDDNKNILKRFINSLDD